MRGRHLLLMFAGQWRTLEERKVAVVESLRLRRSCRRFGGHFSYRAVFVACLWILALAIVAPRAHASFEFVAPFPPPSDEAEGRLDELAAGVAVDEASHDVYVADGQGARVLRYSAEGSF